jgi:hypothetical protein
MPVAGSIIGIRMNCATSNGIMIIEEGGFVTRVT